MFGRLGSIANTFLHAFEQIKSTAEDFTANFRTPSFTNPTGQTEALHYLAQAFRAGAQQEPPKTQAVQQTNQAGDYHEVTQEQLKNIMLPSVPASKKKAFEAILPEYTKQLNDAMKEFGINTPQQQAAFLATLGEESIGLTTRVEGKGSRNISDPSGEGWYGRGFIQLTKKDNYIEASKALKFGDPPNYDLLVRNRELAADPKIAFRTAAWFWTQKHAVTKTGKQFPTASECIGNKPAPSIADFKNASYAVNGWKHKNKSGVRPDPNGWNTRLIYYKRAAKELGVGDGKFYQDLDAQIASTAHKRRARHATVKK